MTSANRILKKLLKKRDQLQKEFHENDIALDMARFRSLKIFDELVSLTRSIEAYYSETKKDLEKLGKKGDTYDDIIQGLLK